MKACKDCKHFSRFWLNKDLSTCKAPNRPTEVDAVNGVLKYGKTFCSIERQSWSHRAGCGPEANWFEPK